MRRHVDEQGPQAHLSPGHARSSPGMRPDQATLLALQRAAGNRGIASALAADQRASGSPSPSGAPAVLPVLQRALNPLNGLKPGRVPDAEQASVVNLLAGNGFSLDDRKRARSDPAHRQDLDDRHAAVLAIEGKFSQGSNVDANKRRRLRVELADEYDRLVDAASQYLDEATAAHTAAIEARVDEIRALAPAENQLFKSGTKIWAASARDATTPSARLLRFTTVDAFRDAVFKRYNAKFKPGAAAAPTGLSGAEAAVLAAEQAAVAVQLTAWQTKRWDAPGCNANGTWGTCASGVIPWNPSHLSRPVWVALSAWWRTKPNAYITPSDTTTYSLKKHRTLAATDNRSATMNYHVWVP